MFTAFECGEPVRNHAVPPMEESDLACLLSFVVGLLFGFDPTALGVGSSAPSITALICLLGTVIGERNLPWLTQSVSHRAGRSSLSLGSGGDFHASNAAKNLFAASLQSCAAILFIMSGVVRWADTAVMIGAGVVGGWLGVRLARSIPLAAMRMAIVGTGLLLTLWFAAG